MESELSLLQCNIVHCASCLFSLCVLFSLPLKVFVIRSISLVAEQTTLRSRVGPGRAMGDDLNGRGLACKQSLLWHRDCFVKKTVERGS